MKLNIVVNILWNAAAMGIAMLIWSGFWFGGGGVSHVYCGLDVSVVCETCDTGWSDIMCFLFECCCSPHASNECKAKLHDVWVCVHRGRPVVCVYISQFPVENMSVFLLFRKLEEVHTNFMDEKDRAITEIYNESKERARYLRPLQGFLEGMMGYSLK